MTYEIVRSRRRTVALEVTREGRVVVRAPLRMNRERSTGSWLHTPIGWRRPRQR